MRVRMPKSALRLCYILLLAAAGKLPSDSSQLVNRKQLGKTERNPGVVESTTFIFRRSHDKQQNKLCFASSLSTLYIPSLSSVIPFLIVASYSCSSNLIKQSFLLCTSGFAVLLGAASYQISTLNSVVEGPVNFEMQSVSYMKILRFTTNIKYLLCSYVVRRTCQLNWAIRKMCPIHKGFHCR